MMNNSWNRRDVLGAAVALGLAPNLSFSESEEMLTRLIPGTSESLPVIGLGTYEVFDVAGSAEEIETRKEIVDMLVEKGGSLIDSSPMYNRSEKIVGDIINASGNRDDLFLATKVWINGKSLPRTDCVKTTSVRYNHTFSLRACHYEWIHRGRKPNTSHIVPRAH